MLFSNITAEGWVLIIGAAGAVAVQLLLQVLQFITTQRAAKRGVENSKKIDSVHGRLNEQNELAAVCKDDLLKLNEVTNAKQDELKTITVAVKQMVNGRYTLQIREKAEAYRKLADVTGTIEDRTLADNAESELARHIENERRLAESQKDQTPQ